MLVKSKHTNPHIYFIQMQSREKYEEVWGKLEEELKKVAEEFRKVEEE